MNRNDGNGGGGRLLKRLGRVRQNGMELLDFLVAELGEGLSKRAVKGLLDERLVFVNGRRIWMAKHLLQSRDVVEVHVEGLKRLKRSAGASSGAAQGGIKKENVAPIRILAEGDGWLVVDKPPRMLTVGEKSLEVRLKEQLGAAGAGVRAVHRLDRDTSGCVLFAKGAEARAALVKEFEEGRVRKVYHALTAGIPPEEQLEIRKMIDGLPAVSHVRTLSVRRGGKGPGAALPAAHVAVSIETGRTHQIRLHLRQLGCPVLGDKEHFAAVSAGFREVGRQMLHAYGLRFRWAGAEVAATAPLPRDFKDEMRVLGLT